MKLCGEEKISQLIQEFRIGEKSPIDAFRVVRMLNKQALGHALSLVEQVELK